MKASEWQRYLESQRRLHGKTIFTVTELANVSGSSPHALNVELERLCKRQLLIRYARGKYGLPEAGTPEELLPYLDFGAYVTGAYALHRHNLTTQVPTEIVCFTNRRHGRSRVRLTAAGKFVFTCVRPPLYAPPADGVLAAPEQALCDWVLTMLRRGLDPASQLTLRGLDRLDISALTQIAARYPATTAREVRKIAAPSR